MTDVKTEMEQAHELVAFAMRPTVWHTAVVAATRREGTFNTDGYAESFTKGMQTPEAAIAWADTVLKAFDKRFID